MITDTSTEKLALIKARKKTGPKVPMEPIKNLEDIAKIKKLLRNNARDYALFVIGIYTAYRAGDILALNISDAMKARASQELFIKEQKTNNRRRVTLSRQAAAALRFIARQRIFEGAKEDEPLFVTEQSNKRLSVKWLGHLVKTWCAEIGLKGSFGTHTLRKTFGYQQRVHNKVPLEHLQAIYGHSSGRITLTYVCIQDDELKAVYTKEF